MITMLALDLRPCFSPNCKFSPYDDITPVPHSRSQRVAGSGWHTPMGVTKESSSRSLFTGLPWWPVVKNPLCDARDRGSIPRPERSHGWWGSWALVPWPLKPAHPRAWAPQQEKPLHWGAQAAQLGSRPYSSQLEKAGPLQPRPSTAIYIFITINIYVFI